MKQVYHFDGKEFKHFSLLNIPEFEKPNTLRRLHDKSTEEVANNIIILDIEATSFSKGERKFGTMYIWMLSIDNEYIYGRTWQELGDTLTKISKEWGLGDSRKAIIFIHNLAYEFGWFISNPIFNFIQSFLKDKGHPLYAIDKRGFEFRCTYMMTNKGLASFDAPVKKLVGDLDYEKPRHFLTEITDKEMHYCFRDVYVPQFYLYKLKEEYKDIYKFPLTKTGFVRQRTRKYCFSQDKYYNFHIKDLHPNEKVYELLKGNPDKGIKGAYMGGYTHANSRYVDEIVEDLTCIDFTSSYPATFLSKMPMGKWWEMKSPTLKDVHDAIKRGDYAMIITFIAKDVSRETDHSIISTSKIYPEYNTRSNVKVDNGKVYKAKVIKMTVTDLDYILIRKYYKMSEIKIESVWCSRYKYLPKAFIECMLDYYGAKTTLKGVAGKEEDYMRGKEDLNSLYGMSVSDIIHTLIEWSKADDDFVEKMDKTPLEQLDDYANSFSTFLVYSWGVWISARARYNLLKMVYQIGEDVVYCDTDSIKFMNGEKYKDLIDNYNKNIIEEGKKCLEYYKIPVERLAPKTVKGKEKPLGVFDYEHPYKRFITQGAKKYMVEYEDGTFETTVAGCSKKGVHFIQAIAYRLGISPLELFRDGFEWGEDYSGRTTATHCYHQTDHFKTTLTDYNGVTAEVEEWSYINIEKCSYTLGKTADFHKYLLNIHEDRSNGAGFMKGVIE